jgi:hypothetical protein
VVLVNSICGVGVVLAVLVVKVVTLVDQVVQYIHN